MSTTEQYARTHKAFAAGAERGGIHAYQARLLVAIAERRQVCTPRQLAEDTQSDGGQVRKWLPGLYDAGLAEGIAVDGGPRRRGVETHVRLTAEGRKLARWMLRRAHDNGAVK